MKNDLVIRMGDSQDVEPLARFNIAMAWETERKELDPETVAQGVHAVLDQPEHGNYASQASSRFFGYSESLAKSWSLGPLRLLETGHGDLTMKIMALDLGKYKTVFCDYDSINGERAFGKVKTTPQEIHDLIVEKEPDRVVLEVCGIAGWVVDIAEALGKATEVANPMHDAWRWKNVKKKTDREDALKLAKLSAMGQLPTVHMPQKAVREKRALLKHRQRLVKYRTSLKNAIRALVAREGIPMTRGKASWSREGLAWLEGQATELAEISDPTELWRGQLYMELTLLRAVNDSLKVVEDKLNQMATSDERIQRLQKIKGVGPRLAETVVAFLDDPKRFQNGKQVGSYVGLVPRQYQSGQMERQGRTGGRGNLMLRNLLIEVCWASLSSNPWARETYHRLLRGTPSRKKIAITGVARKLVVRCWAMLRHEQDWQDHIPKRVA
jgi:transposase